MGNNESEIKYVYIKEKKKKKRQSPLKALGSMVRGANGVTYFVVVWEFRRNRPSTPILRELRIQ